MWICKFQKVQIFRDFLRWILSVVLKILMWRRDFFQFPCYSQEVKIPQKFIVREGGKGKREKVLCNFVRGHNRYLVSGQQEIASRRDFLAGELPCWGQILQNNMKVKNVLGFCPFATAVYWVLWILGESNWFEFHWLIMMTILTCSIARYMFEYWYRYVLTWILAWVIFPGMSIARGLVHILVE